MAKQVIQFNLLVSCPSDVKEELEVIKETVDSFNRMYGAVNNAHIIVKHWSTDSYPQSGGAPQKLLNQQFVLECDAAVAVFWTRFGTPTDEYGSGTEEEIEELIKSGKQVFLYFSDCQVNPSSLDQEQYQKVLAFRSKYRDKGIYWPYSSLDDFKKSFLNHLSLYFVKILTNKNTKVKTDNSKLNIKGVAKGKITDDPLIFKRNYSKSEFIQGIQNTISNLFGQIKEIVLPKTIVETEESSQEEMSLPIKNLSSKLGEVTQSLQEQLKGIGSMFPSSKVTIDIDIKNVIKTYAKDNSINLKEDEFFFIGDLSKQQHLIGGGPYGTSPSHSLVGSEAQKSKYKLIRELYWKIDEYKQYVRYLLDVDSKFYLELALSNFGTSYDEDVDIKIYIKKGLLCTKENLPIPEDDILETINKLFNSMFKSQKTVEVDEYNNYPVTSSIPYIPTFGVGGPTYEDEVKSNKNEYQNNLNTAFCYDYFQEGEYDILRYNQKYIKQNTIIFFPTVLIFNAVPDKLYYEISSKHFSEIIKGELNIMKNF